MDALQNDIDEYKRQLEKGAIRRAYRGLMEYILRLRTLFASKYPDYYVSGGVYPGYMDMTYFSLTPESLKRQGLKIAIVFVHPACRFEAWLAGYNKQVQAKTWKMFNESGWDRYPLAANPANSDAIVAHVLVDSPDFNDLEALTAQVEGGALQFIADIEGFLADRG